MKVLFVNACIRGADSRTLHLAQVFLHTLKAECLEASITEHNLSRMGLLPVDAETLSRKETLCDAHAWNENYLAPAVAFQQADVVVFAAPYWDMSFPSLLKIWVENMYVRNLTFRYEKDQSVGLCQGREAVYLTTAGSSIGNHDWGTGYIRDVMQVLGIPGFTAIKAEALDLAGRDVEAIMQAACQEAERQAKALASCFSVNSHKADNPHHAKV